MAKDVTRKLTEDERAQLREIMATGYIGMYEFDKITTPGERAGYLIAEQTAGRLLEKANMFRAIGARSNTPAGVGPNGVADRLEQYAMTLLDLVGVK